MQSRSTFFKICVPTLLLLVSADARAADEKAQEQARKLYEEAKKAMVDGDYTVACPRLEAAKALLPEHLNTGILLAECYVDAKKLASAAAELARVKQLAQSQGRTDKLTDINERLTRIGPHVPTLTIVVPERFAGFVGLSVKRGSLVLTREEWGKPAPVDPGDYEVFASADGYSPWSKKVSVKGEDDKIEVTLEPGWEPPKKPEAPPPPTPWQRPVSYTAMGLGAVGLAMGGILGSMALSRNAKSDDGYCDERNHCNQTGYDLRTEARALGNGSTIAFAVGGLLAAGGLTLFLLSPRAPKDAEESAESARVTLGVGFGSVEMRGSF